jgi:hypothetical protein
MKLIKPEKGEYILQLSKDELNIIILALHFYKNWIGNKLLGKIRRMLNK